MTNRTISTVATVLAVLACVGLTAALAKAESPGLNCVTIGKTLICTKN